MLCRISVSLPGIKPMPSAMEAQSLNHWFTREVLAFYIFPSYVFVCVCVCVCALNHVRLFAALWTVACQASLSAEFSRQEYWSGVPFPSLGDLPDAGSKPLSLAFPVVAGRFFTTSVTWEAPFPSCLWSISSNQYLCQIFAIAWILWDTNGWSHWLWRNQTGLRE